MAGERADTQGNKEIERADTKADTKDISWSDVFDDFDPAKASSQTARDASSFVKAVEGRAQDPSAFDAALKGLGEKISGSALSPHEKLDLLKAIVFEKNLSGADFGVQAILSAKAEEPTDTDNNRQAASLVDLDIIVPGTDGSAWRHDLLNTDDPRSKDFDRYQIFVDGVNAALKAVEDDIEKNPQLKQSIDDAIKAARLKDNQETLFHVLESPELESMYRKHFDGLFKDDPELAKLAELQRRASRRLPGDYTELENFMNTSYRFATMDSSEYSRAMRIMDGR